MAVSTLFIWDLIFKCSFPPYTHNCTRRLFCIDPVRIPSSSFSPVTVNANEVVSYYITCTSGSYIQLTEFEGQRGALSSETTHVQEFIGISKVYPFLEALNDVGWNGRIYSDLLQSLRYCGNNLQEALRCDYRYPNGLDDECPSGEIFFQIIHSFECEPTYDDDDTDFVQDNQNKFYCGATYADAANCGKSYGETGLDSECDNWETW